MLRFVVLLLLTFGTLGMTGSFATTGRLQAAPPALQLKRPLKLRLVNAHLAGQVLDYTNNHFRDNRIWSESLGRPLDMYVYLPPGYREDRVYPVFYWLHGFTQDENCLIDHIITPLDRAIRAGKMPPVVVVAPDGNIRGNAGFLNPGSFFANTKAGRFEDMLLIDVENFVHSHFSIAKGRENHAIGGVSMGGGSAFRIALKYPERFKDVVGIFPPLNIRYEGKSGRYLSDYWPGNWQFRDDFSRGLEPVGRFFGGLVTLRLRDMLDPLYDRRDPNLPTLLASENPAELVIFHNNAKYPLSMYIGSAGKDEFNIDSQINTFLESASGKGMDIKVDYIPHGRHNLRTAYRLAPSAIGWLGSHLWDDED